jgi:hypothetical protein
MTDNQSTSNTTPKDIPAPQMARARKNDVVNRRYQYMDVPTSLP